MSARGSRKLSNLSEIYKCLNFFREGANIFQLSLKLKKTKPCWPSWKWGLA